MLTNICSNKIRNIEEVAYVYALDDWLGDVNSKNDADKIFSIIASKILVVSY